MSRTELAAIGQQEPRLSKSAAREEKLLRAALDSNDYRSFIRNISIALSPNGKANMAALSRKAGFSSRGFIGEVIDGRRRLSPLSYPKLTRALVLPTRIRSYFHLLVIRDEPDLNFEQLDPLTVEIKLKEQRARLHGDLENIATRDQKAEDLLKARDMIDCYAAMGEGATLEQIASRTGFTKDYVSFVLNHFVTTGTAKKVGDRFVVDDPVVFFKDLGESQNAKTCYLQTLTELRRKAEASFHAKDRTFSQFLFTVDSHRMTELKKKLSDLMREFMETSESSNGDRVAKLAIGFYI